MATTPQRRASTPTGIGQEELHAILTNMVTVVNDLKDKVSNIVTDLTAIRGNYNSMHASVITAASLVGTFGLGALTAAASSESDLTLGVTS